jgi:hypothetical protein
MAEEMPSLHERVLSSAWETLEAKWREFASAVGLSAEVASAELLPSAQGLHVAIPDGELCVRLRMAVEEAASRDADSMNALRLAVRSFTVALRDDGATPERALITLKTVIHNRDFLLIAPHASDWTGDLLRQKITTWSIEEFFRERDGLSLGSETEKWDDRTSPNSSRRSVDPQLRGASGDAFALKEVSP